MPQQKSLDIIGQITMSDIVCALEECEKLQKTSLMRSDSKRIFGDYGQRVMYTCFGVHVTRNSRAVFNCNAFIDNFLEHHWAVLMKLMQHVDYCFEAIADNVVISHMYHAKQVVSFKTTNTTLSSRESTVKYYRGLAFGCYVLAQCHTDAKILQQAWHIST